MLFKLHTIIDDDKTPIECRMTVTREDILYTNNYMLHYKLFDISDNCVGYVDITVEPACIFISYMKNNSTYHNVGRALHEIAFKVVMHPANTGPSSC